MIINRFQLKKLLAIILMVAFMASIAVITVPTKTYAAVPTLKDFSMIRQMAVT